MVLRHGKQKQGVKIALEGLIDAALSLMGAEGNNAEILKLILFSILLSLCLSYYIFIGLIVICICLNMYLSDILL